MIASYLLSSTLVPVMAAWLFRRPREGHSKLEGASRFGWLQGVYERLVARTLRQRAAVIGIYALATGVLFFAIGGMRNELFPRVDAGQLQIRIRAPAGTRLERTEEIVRKVDRMIRDEVGDAYVTTTLANVGNPPWSYPVNGGLSIRFEPAEQLFAISQALSEGGPGTSI